jgi:uncharacterized protein YciI
MTRWAAIFEDTSGSESQRVREQYAAEHFAYLAEHRDKIVLAGGLRHNPEDWYCGGLWIIEVDQRDDAARLCENDPFFKRGLRKSYQLYVWGKAPPYGPVTL